MPENKKVVKQSLLTGALTGSFGIFISKALGLFYVIPLNQMAGTENMAFYSITYTYYDLLLKVCSAGIPFAIAALVAKYVDRNDYKTAQLVRKVGTSFILAISFVVSVLFFMVSKPLAAAALGVQASAQDVANLYNLFKILLLAVITVPLLSSIRGYYQGLKQMGIYATSQVLEQFIRVFSIVFLSFIAVKVFSFDGVYAVYMAILSASIAAVLTILYFYLATKERDREFRQSLLQQTTPALDSKRIFHEMLSLGIPYVLISFLGTAGPMINSNFFVSYATSVGMDYSTAKAVLAMVETNCSKIASIPEVLTLGFSAGLVPYLTESYERQDRERLKKQLSEIFSTVLYILLPIALGIFFYSKAIYFIMYNGWERLELGGTLLRNYSLVAFTDTIAPIVSSVLITLRFRKKAILFLLLSLCVKAVSFFGLIPLAGYTGMIYSTALGSLLVIVMGMVLLKKVFGFDVRMLSSVAVRTLLSSLISIVPLYLFNLLIPLSFDNRILCLLMFGVEALLMMVIYLFVSSKMYLPQQLFHLKQMDIKALIKKFRH